MSNLQKLSEIPSPDLKRYAVQVAATVLYICKMRCPEVSRGPDSEDGYDPIAVMLSEYAIEWAPDDFTEGLQRMVELLYGAQAQHIAERTRLDPGERRIIADALSAYQRWKTAHLVAKEAHEGRGREYFGRGVGSYQKDWTDQNAAFLDLVNV